MILRLRKTYMRLTVDSLARRLRVGDDMPKAERVVAILDDMVSPYPFFYFYSVYRQRTVIGMESKADGVTTAIR